jgi:hypothetical protein
MVRHYGLRLEEEPLQKTHLVPFARRGGHRIPDDESFRCLFGIYNGLPTPGATWKMVSAAQVTRMNRHSLSSSHWARIVGSIFILI